MKFWTVDAFTTKPFSGNPAAVILVDEFPTDGLCQTIASELCLPETGFIKEISSDRFHIRWFTPLVEVPLCGHGTLAAAHILFNEGYGKNDQIVFESLSGELPTIKKDSKIILDFPLYESENQFYDKDILKDRLGLKSCYSAFLSHNAIIAELEEEELRSYEPNFETIRDLGYNGLILTAKGQKPYDFVSRVFGPQKGINEDHVTGSAHCLLVDYWRGILGQDTFFVYQASPRGGEIDLEISGNRVHLSGQAITITEGKMFHVEHVKG